MSTLWQHIKAALNRIKAAVKRLNLTEPARLRAIWTAVIALLAAVGVSVSADLDAKVTAVIGLLAVLLPIVQGEATRANVYSPATVERISREQEVDY